MQIGKITKIIKTPKKPQKPRRLKEDEAIPFKMPAKKPVEIPNVVEV